MNLQFLVKALLVRLPVVLVTTVIGAAIAVGYVLLSDKVYQSTASVVAVVRAPDTLGPQSVAEQLAADYLLTQEDILKSDRVARQVVTDSGIADRAGAAQQFGWTAANGPLPDFIAQQLAGGLSVKSSATNSRVMEISYYSGDPDFSASMANAFANAFIEVNVQLQGDPARRTVQSYTKQMEALSAKMDEVQKTLSAKQRQLGIVASKGEADPDSARLAALSSNLAAAQAASAETQAQTSGGSLPDSLSNSVVQGLQSELARLEAQRRQLAETAGPNNPDYVALASQIGAMRQQLAQQQELIRRGAAARAAQARLAERGLSGAVQTQRSQVIASRAAQNEVAVVEQDLANLRASYDQLSQRRAALQVLDNTAQTNISLLSAAVPNAKPVSPRRLLSLFMGVVLGFGAGVLIAFALEFADRRIRSSDQIEGWLGIPDLGSIRTAPGERRRQIGLFPTRLLPRAGT